MLKEFLKKIITKIRNINKSNTILNSYVPKSVFLEEYIVIEKDTVISNKLSSIGVGTYINSNVIIDRCEEIGKYCSISKFVKIGLGSHPTNMVSTSPIFYSKKRRLVNEDTYNNKEVDKPVIIKNDVWIGNGAIIMPGVTVGNGAIIGANAVVTKDVPDYSIVVGIPATIKKYRFDSNIRDNLIKSEWWNIDINILSKNFKNMKDPNLFLEIINNEKSKK